MLFNVRELLKSNLAVEIEFNDLTPTLAKVLCDFADYHDSRFPIATSTNSMAASFGVDELYYADDTVLNQLITTYTRAYFRLIDMLVYDQIILDALSNGVREEDIDYTTRDSELAVCLLTIRKNILDALMQLA